MLLKLWVNLISVSFPLIVLATVSNARRSSFTQISRRVRCHIHSLSNREDGWRRKRKKVTFSHIRGKRVHTNAHWGSGGNEKHNNNNNNRSNRLQVRGQGTAISAFFLDIFVCHSGFSRLTDESLIYYSYMRWFLPETVTVSGKKFIVNCEKCVLIKKLLAPKISELREISTDDLLMSRKRL